MITSSIWLPASLIAGGLQAWRTAVQRKVGQSLSVNAAGLVRYLYGLPFALAFLALYHLVVRPGAVPSIGTLGLLFCAGAGLCQIIATNLLLMTFGERNFVVGTAYAKTEAAQGAILSWALMSEQLHPLAWAGVAAGVVGIMILSTGGKRMGPGEFIRALGAPSARYGLASGFFFALTAVGIRLATQEAVTPDPVSAALMVLAITVAMQTAMQGAFLAWREPAQMRAVFTTWRVSGQVGLLSSLGSAFWFTGFATAPIALVRIVGQIEIVFTLSLAHYYLREPLKTSEVTGLLLVVSGVLLALIGAARPG